MRRGRHILHFVRVATLMANGVRKNKDSWQATIMKLEVRVARKNLNSEKLFP